MSKSILVLGAGRSSAVLIEYLAHTCHQRQWKFTVGDYAIEAAQKMTEGLPTASAILFDINQKAEAARIVSQHDVVVSLMPAHLHHHVAELCFQHGKHLVTASYVTAEMKAYDAAAKEKGLIFLNECGLDPGIDHMSAMQVINKIKAKGGKMISFESFTGGLISPETDPQNPWRYKFTWNSRNVVMAGQSTAKYLENKEFKYIPYQQLFQRLTSVHVPGLGDYEGYANRDSLKYISAYGLDSIQTMLRGTLRNKGFCSAWNVLVQLGCCDDTFQVDGLKDMTHARFLQSFLPPGKQSLKQRVEAQLRLPENAKELAMLEWVGLFSDEPVGIEKGTPAQALEHVLNKKWKLASNDKDQIVMWHRFIYELNGVRKEIQATLVATGDDSVKTAMAKTVGLPLAIAAKLIAENKIVSRGVVIPTIVEIYEPVLTELAALGIELSEREIQ
jgi:saccharopine dehydrogenase-like NADP-dependent oxidoreductase